MLQRVVGVRGGVGGGAARAVGFAASCLPQLPPRALLRIRILMLTAGGLYCRPAMTPSICARPSGIP
jgi:hypothetical protein